MDRPERTDATARDGTRIAYRLRSGGAGRPRIALVHSLAMDGDFWSPVADRLQDELDVLTWDCRGHGRSGKPAGPYRVEQFADDLADLLDHVGWPTASIAGASMGGSVAIAFAAAHGARVETLGLIDTTAWYGADAAKNWAERAAKAKAEGLVALVAFQQTRWFGDAFRDANPDVVAHCVETFLANDVDAFVATCGMLGAFDLRSALPTFRMPTAIAVGSEDYATPPAMAEILHGAIPHARYEILDGARHLTPIERADAVAAILRELVTLKESA